ncbi:amidase domain-containing protein [Paenibacillus macerans]|uniref:amidase domain-containing protein n=1 Tax=Paenibacillus TaxID=44249 RepID=UPI000979CC7D|nr:amidase domain-containing protein [Paenibacillus macerans]MEC0137611.1 amidase domain-containing protein [Paenibacillus macerans]OMG46584.1 hypothetical protein BK140_26140 [Paenibacillus macerans]
MARRKKSIVTLLCSVVVLSITPVNAAESISIPLDEQVLQQDSASTKEKLDSILETSVTQAVYAAENNPYIEQYLIEQEADPNENYLGNPEEEEKIALEALNIIYKEDIKVGELLAKLTENDEMIKKATSLNRDRIIEVLHIIVDNFFKVDESEKDLLLGYMERYAVNVGDKASIELYHENKKNYDSAKISPFASYDRAAAGEWAYKNYNKYSTDYPAFTGGWGSDCTNFVSQAMHVGGGLPFKGDWYVYKKNSKYLVPTSAEELDYSWDLADPSPFISVQAFYDYWRSRSTVYAFSHDYYVSNHETIYYKHIYKGDVVVFSKGVSGVLTMPTHIMIVSAYDTNNEDFKLAGHSNERQAYPLLDAIEAYAQVEFFCID